MTLLHQAAQKAVEAAVSLAQIEELAKTMWKGEPVPGRVLRFGAAVLGLVDAALQHQEVPREPVAPTDDEILAIWREVRLEDESYLGLRMRFARALLALYASPSTTRQQEVGSIVAELVAGLQRAETKRKQKLSDLPAGTCETCMGEGYLGSIESQRVTDCPDCIGGVRVVAAAPSTPERAGGVSDGVDALGEGQR